MGGWQREWKRETQRSSCAKLAVHTSRVIAKRMEERNTKVIICFTVHTSWVARLKNRRDYDCTDSMNGWQRESKRKMLRSLSAGYTYFTGGREVIYILLQLYTFTEYPKTVYTGPKEILWNIFFYGKMYWNVVHIFYM